jgi:allantoinase
VKPNRDGPFPYSPINKRPPLEWPGGARVAMWVVPNVEFFPLDARMPGPSNERPTGNETIPMVREWAIRDYGNRVGIFRIMEVLDRHNIRATISLNSDVCDMRPQLIEEFKQRGWEIMGHNQRNTERLNQIPPEREGPLIRDVLDKIEASSGTRPVGWLSAGSYETWNTLDHLIDNGVRYVCDWGNDDQPYRMQVGDREIISLPYARDINDNDGYLRQKQSVAEFEHMICEQFDVLYREGQRVMTISVHPFLTGQAHRIGALDRALAYIGKFPGVWKATGREIMEHFNATQPAR